MGRCLAPCDGRVGLEPYEELVRSLISSLSTPDGLLTALEARMRELADQERFEEAALARDRLRALAEALARSRTDRWLLSSEELILRDATGAILRLRGGALDGEGDCEPIPSPCPRERADELAALRGWISRNPVRIEHAATPLAEPVDGGSALRRILRQTSSQTIGQPNGHRDVRSNPQPNGG
jgi:hypothetical protein